MDGGRRRDGGGEEPVRRGVIHHGAEDPSDETVQIQEVEQLEAPDLLDQIIDTGIKPRDDEAAERGRS